MATNDFAPCVPVSARPLPECYEDNCICPWGHNYDRSKEICVPRPGYKHETMGPSGVHCTIRFAVANLVCLIIRTLHELHASRAYIILATINSTPPYFSIELILKIGWPYRRYILYTRKSVYKSMERSFPPRLKIPRSTCYTENTSGTSFQKKKKEKA